MWEIEEALGHMLEIHSEDERGDIPDPEGLVDKIYELKLRLERARLTGIDSIPPRLP